MRKEKDRDSKLYFSQHKLFVALPHNWKTGFGAPATAAPPHQTSSTQPLKKISFLAVISLSSYPLNVPTHLFHSFPLSQHTIKRLMHSSARYNPYWWFAEISPSPPRHSPRSPTPPPLIQKRVNEVGRWSCSLAKDDDLVPIDRVQGDFRERSVAITSRYCQLSSVISVCDLMTEN